MTVIRSPLRYPGGKSKLFPFMADLIARNSLYNCTYREPYAGGAGLALNLLFAGYAKSIILNDIDPAIYSFWWAVINRNSEFQRKVHDIKFNIDEWHNQKAIWLSPKSSNELELGFAAYYLNRTNRSGIIEGAGPIGGYAQSGTYKMDARFSLDDQLTMLQLIGSAKDRISVKNEDALSFISSNCGREPELTYLDPPYYIKGQRLYRNYYNHSDHEAIARLMKSYLRHWLVSYDDVDEIRQLYSWRTPVSLVLQYSAGPTVSGKEVMFLSEGLSYDAGLLRAA
ncbi:DNA adenine methylase [Sphingomonas sp. Leaf33]|uniref:DNA adenine methylase n=1 Tax=Sphingomonas sp. Leaf33 TaxID=1736215 RepID=UPI0009E9FD0D|nr:DNA adenine methylase [Sphingomonas sp. Leaf33]